MNQTTASRILSAFDAERLMPRVDEILGNATAPHRHAVRELHDKIAQSEIVSPESVPANVVTMNSIVRLVDEETQREYVYSLCFPSDSNPYEGRVSVFGPVGKALFGSRVGDTVEWDGPRKRVRLKVKEILYQPEAAGHFHL